MARRPVVIQGPPKDEPRVPVVVRQGAPPKDRRHITDTALGAIGAVLLVLAVALFGILPDEEVPPRLFQVTYQENVIEDGDVKNLLFEDQQTQRVLLPVESSNVYSIQVTVEFADDEPSTLPDTFGFQILDPNSDPAMDEVRFDTPDPESDGNPVLPTFTAPTSRQILTIQIAEPPKDGPQSPSSDEEDLANARARISDETQTRPAGDWILEIFLAATGDCPSPVDEGGPGHAAACEAATNQEGDSGNSLQVVKVSFTTYEALVED